MKSTGKLNLITALILIFCLSIPVNGLMDIKETTTCSFKQEAVEYGSRPTEKTVIYHQQAQTSDATAAESTTTIDSLLGTYYENMTAEEVENIRNTDAENYSMIKLTMTIMEIYFDEETGKLCKDTYYFHHSSGTSYTYPYDTYNIDGNIFTASYPSYFLTMTPDYSLDTVPGTDTFEINGDGNLISGEVVWYKVSNECLSGKATGSSQTAAAASESGQTSASSENTNSGSQTGNAVDAFTGSYLEGVMEESLGEYDNPSVITLYLDESTGKLYKKVGLYIYTAGTQVLYPYDSYTIDGSTLTATYPYYERSDMTNGGFSPVANTGGQDVFTLDENGNLNVGGAIWYKTAEVIRGYVPTTQEGTTTGTTSASGGGSTQKQTTDSRTTGNYGTYKVKVDSGYLALRTAMAFDSSNEIGALYTGETVTVTEKSSSDYWYVYSSKLGKYGYVNCHYLVSGTSGGTSSGTSKGTSSGTSSGTSKGTSSGTTSKSGNYGTYTVKVDSGYLALRSAMAFDSSNEIGALYTGETVTVKEKTSSDYWYVYSSKLGKSGYVNCHYLVSGTSSGSSGGTTSKSGNYGTYTVKVDSGYLALRSAMAFDSSNEIGKLYTGEKVTVKEKTSSDYWYVYSSKLGKSGYVNCNYLVK